MPTIQEVVKDHRQHYLDRKLARSPLLHFSPGAHRIDLHELFRGIQPNLPAVDRNANGCEWRGIGSQRGGAKGSQSIA